MVAEDGLVIIGVGLTVTVYVNVAVPGHPFAVGMILYVTAIGADVVLFKVSVIVLLVCDDTGALLMPATAARLQVNVAPLTLLAIL